MQDADFTPSTVFGGSEGATMRMVEQKDYRGYTLLKFEPRVPENHPKTHWIVIAPGGINIVGSQHATEADARAFVDQLLDTGAAAAPQPAQ